MPVTLGLERLLDSGSLSGARVGLVCNPASVDRSLRHAADRVAGAAGVQLAALFGPQHGYRSDVQDNMIESGHEQDAVRRIPVYSLYSETREPTAAMLAGLDALVIDLQDIGVRIYTFIYTMANCLRACRTHGLRAIVCDRPNPIGGLAIEGPTLVPGYESFVGQFPIPLRHGLTIGELARLFNEVYGIGCDLEVIPMDGWNRADYFDATCLPWVMPSPNMPTLDTAIVYPGAVLFEGTRMSEGRGTTRPFELIGAPWIDARRLTDRLNAQDIPGVHFRAVEFQPTFHKYESQTCGGCQIHVLDRESFRPVLAAVALLGECRAHNPTAFEWREPPYEYEHTKMPIDILSGSDQLRRQIEAGSTAREIAGTWEPQVRAFETLRRSVLLYP